MKFQIYFRIDISSFSFLLKKKMKYNSNYMYNVDFYKLVNISTVSI